MDHRAAGAGGAAILTAGLYAAQAGEVIVNGNVSFWYRQIGLPRRRDPLDGPVEADVCVVGAGFTGLWTAYYLTELDPGLRVVLVEKEFAGFGASGRNGGWLSAQLAGSPKQYARTHGTAAVAALARAMRDAVDEVIAIAAAEEIGADITKSGVLRVAHAPAQLARLRAHDAEDRKWGIDDGVPLSARETTDRIAVDGALGSVFHPQAARVHPAKLVQGLAAAVVRRGVTIYESTPVTAIEPGVARTPFGDVRAPYVIRATEGFTAGLAGERRTWLPMNSSMIATEPLPPETWARIGWNGYELLGDEAHAYLYAQRTADDRIAIGGRGIPYRFGSRTDRRGRTQAWTVRELHHGLSRLLPDAAAARIDHAWCGVLGVPRDWCSTVTFDPATGLGYAGGYVGHGVTTTNLAGRTLADLITGADTDRAHLPWVGHQVRDWEPEPLRWLGVRALYTAYRAADRAEENSVTTSPLARLADRISGR